MNESELTNIIHLQPDKFYCLSEDVQFVKLIDLPDAVRNALSASDTDYAVCRIGQRIPALVIDTSTYELLSHFEESVRLLDVISSYAASNNVESKNVLQDAYPLLRKCRRAGVLRSADLPPVEIPIPTLSVGDCHAGHSVIRVVSTQVDTEVYETQDNEGRLVALKIARIDAGDDVRHQIENEVTTLARIRGHIAPDLLGYDINSDTPWLATTWITGRTVDDAATEHRARAALGHPGAIIRLIAETAKVYAELHSKNILHGDIQPLNVLVATLGQPVIIDFGLAHEMESPSPMKERAMVAYFMEPECAQAMLRKQTPPPYTEQAEQFALAALLYYLATGQHYADFKLEREEMLQQISDSRPRSFEELDITPIHDLEAVLHQALEKNPEKRFLTMKDFVVAIRDATPIANSTSFQAQTRNRHVKNAEAFIRFADIPSVEPDMIREGPLANVAFGKAGIAVGMLYGSEVIDSPELLAAADLWISKAWRDTSMPTAFSVPDMGQELAEQPEISLLYHQAGLIVTEGLIAAAMNDAARFKNCVGALQKHIDNNIEHPWEFVGGYAGLLMGVALLYSTGLESDDLKVAGQALEKKLLSHIEKAIETGEYLTGKLGIAHGWAGVLYAISEWRRTVGYPLPTVIIESLNKMVAVGLEQDSGLTWPVSIDQQDISFGSWWCNGSAGFVHLYCSAAAVQDSEDFMTVAERAGEYTFQHLSELTDICCGLAGRAYALFRLYRTTKNSLWFERGCQLTTRAIELGESSEQLPHALYKGGLGIQLLKLMVDNSGDIKMPLFEV